MDIRPIRTDEDHAEALVEIERLWGSAPGTPEGDKLVVLAILVETYEEERWPIEASDPIDVLGFPGATLTTSRPTATRRTLEGRD